MEQIKKNAPKHATLLNSYPASCPARPIADLTFVSVNLVFIVGPLFCFLFGWSVTKVVRKTRREVMGKVWKNVKASIATGKE